MPRRNVKPRLLIVAVVVPVFAHGPSVGSVRRIKRQRCKPAVAAAFRTTRELGKRRSVAGERRESTTPVRAVVSREIAIPRDVHHCCILCFEVHGLLVARCHAIEAHRLDVTPLEALHRVEVNMRVAGGRRCWDCPLVDSLVFPHFSVVRENEHPAAAICGHVAVHVVMCTT